MRLLLDTQVVLWASVEPAHLRDETRRLLRNGTNDVFVSAISPWELAIKQATGKLTSPADLLEALRRQRFAELVVTWEHGQAAGALPQHHRDPFDRMLVAQAQAEGLTIVTRDPHIPLYDVQTLPA